CLFLHHRCSSLSLCSLPSLSFVFNDLSPTELYALSLHDALPICGLAGAALALLLRRQRRWRVTLVEAVALPPANETPFTPSFDARSTALSAGTLDIFSRIGIDDALLPYAADIRVVHVSRRGRPGIAHIRAEEENLPRLGAVVENRWLGRVLLNKVRADDGIEVIAPDHPASVQRQQGGYRVTLESGRVLECALLV